MAGALVITLRFHDGRYHGAGYWPPSPARLFQALVAGAATGKSIARGDKDALSWLETLDAPLMGAPAARKGLAFVNYVPNNDLDSVAGDPRRVDEIRTEKAICPYLFDPEIPLIYLWILEAGSKYSHHANQICSIAERLYQIGRGVDMACAWAEILDESQLRHQMDRYAGHLHKPTDRGNGVALDCPIPGSLRSLEERFAASRQRFQRVSEAKGPSTEFSQTPKPRFDSVAYDSPAEQLLFDLRTTLGESPFVPWRLTRVCDLAVGIRDRAAERLKGSLPQRAAEIDRILIGRDSTEADKTARVKIVPLPSVGHPSADRSIRRVLVEVPPNCPLQVRDVEWGFSDLALVQKIRADTGELLEDLRLVPADERDMLRHYGMEKSDGARVWRTVTPAALPALAARRRIDPRRIRYELKGALERTREQYAAAASVLQALRHAGINKAVEAIRVQREPFDGKGSRAEAFADAVRFRKERLWHVEVAFTEPVAGLVILGDGRYMGLGLMRPVRETTDGVLCFAIVDGLTERAEPAALSQALRRAVMARVQEEIGQRNRLPAFFTGHEVDGTPLRAGHHAHLAFAADLPRSRLLVVAPHMLEGREARHFELQHLAVLERAVAGMHELRAGPAGLLRLARHPVQVAEDPLLAAARTWVSITDYQPTRHIKRTTKEDALATDIRSELRRRQIDHPERIDVIELREGPRGGISGRLRLHFASAVTGLFMIGRTRHVGGGLFAACVEAAEK